MPSKRWERFPTPFEKRNILKFLTSCWSTGGFSAKLKTEKLNPYYFLFFYSQLFKWTKMELLIKSCFTYFSWSLLLSVFHNVPQYSNISDASGWLMNVIRERQELICGYRKLRKKNAVWDHSFFNSFDETIASTEFVYSAKVATCSRIRRPQVPGRVPVQGPLCQVHREEPGRASRRPVPARSKAVSAAPSARTRTLTAFHFQKFQLQPPGYTQV